MSQNNHQRFAAYCISRRGNDVGFPALTKLRLFFHEFSELVL